MLDDARSLSLFAPNRVVWVSGAETALPRGRAASDDENSAAAELAAYLKHPTPGTVLVFEASRYDFEGEDRAKLERVQKFYSAIPDVVELRPYTLESARRLAQDLAKEAGLQIGLAEIGLLVESLAADAGRIANEIEKLRLYTGGTRKVTADDILRLVPNAPASTIFALVGALGRGDRKRALDSLDTLLREGEYLPLALTFLATQFRLAMAARDSGLKTLAADPGAVLPAGHSHLARSRRAGLSNRGSIPGRQTWHGPSRRSSGPTKRYGTRGRMTAW